MRKRIVVKLGTSVLTGGSGSLDRPHLVELARQMAGLHRAGHELLICTSGAVAAGREVLSAGPPEHISQKQMLAAVGQSRLMLRWEEAFDIYGIHLGQVLLTLDDVRDHRRFLNAREALRELLAHRIIPTINENDVVATEELRVGDNDSIAAYTAILTDADALYLLTDQSGLFTRDPRQDPEAELIPEVHSIDRSLKEIAGESVGGLGVGGMATKLRAADLARRAGVDVVIASGRAPEVISRLVHGESIGTRFPALEDPVEGRKSWIMAAMKPGARVIVDDGAADALMQRQKSLLPCGVVAVEGPFGRGNAVSVVNEQNEELCRGVARYSSSELQTIRGHQSGDIEVLLGYTLGPVAIHRRDLVRVRPDHEHTKRAV